MDSYGRKQVGNGMGISGKSGASFAGQSVAITHRLPPMVGYEILGKKKFSWLVV